MLVSSVSARAALLAYEPFTNTVGTAIIGSSGGTNFSGPWQTNNSGGVATNTASGLSYTDAASNSLVTLGGAGFFQGLTTANTSMQPIRPFNFSRGTNGTDGGTTWISFLIVRQGPVNGSVTNGWLRGANVPHDLGVSNKLAIGNSSGAATNTVGLIPQGSSTLLKPSTVLFGGRTNFVVVRVDHVASANDNAWLFVNPSLATEPATSAANTNSLGTYDFSFDTLRVFAGGQNSASQPYAEIIVDEYRIGETYADVAPYTPSVPPAPLIITNTALTGNGVVLAGTGGTSNGNFAVLSFTNLLVNSTNWPAIATNPFDGGGNFICTNPLAGDPGGTFFRLLVVSLAPPPPVAPNIVTSPTNLTVLAGQPAAFSATATGTAPLTYQWLFNTNTPLSGATSSNLSIASAQLTNAGGYSLRVANTAGAVTSIVASLTVLSPPAITAQPQSQTILFSNAASFSVTTTGTAPLRYQWFFNTNNALLNATNASFNIAVVQVTNAGTYSVWVTNNYGAVTSLFATLTVNTSASVANYYVATNGSDSNNGTNIATPFATLTKAVSVASAGKLIYIRGGTYNSPGITNSISGTPTQPIRIFAYPGESPILNFSGTSTGTRGFTINGNCWHLKGLEIAYAGDNGIWIGGKTNTIELCVLHDNEDSGLQLANGGAAFNYILNCDSYRNYDVTTHGENADGFAAKFDLGPGNVFSGCRSWENSDDGWDLWQATNTVVLTNCWTWNNGTNAWGDTAFAGDGNGIKLGGNNYFGPHVVYRCVAFKNPGTGFDQNNNASGLTLYNCTAWANANANYNLNHGTNTTTHVVQNNLSIAGSQSIRSPKLETNNSWQAPINGATTGDVLGTDMALALSPRQADGSLPVVDFLRPVPGGRLVDAGVDVGLPYNGAAPDIGAFEAP